MYLLNCCVVIELTKAKTVLLLSKYVIFARMLSFEFVSCSPMNLYPSPSFGSLCPFLLLFWMDKSNGPK